MGGNMFYNGSVARKYLESSVEKKYWLKKSPNKY